MQSRRERFYIRYLFTLLHIVAFRAASKCWGFHPNYSAVSVRSQYLTEGMGKIPSQRHGKGITDLSTLSQLSEFNWEVISPYTAGPMSQRH